MFFKAVDCPHNSNQDTKTALWSYMQEIFDEKTLTKLLSKVKYRGNSLFENLYPARYDMFEPFIIKACTDNEMPETFIIWIFAAEVYSLEFMKQLCSTVDQKGDEFSSSFYTKLFKFQNQKNENILKCARRNKTHHFKKTENIVLSFLTGKANMSRN